MGECLITSKVMQTYDNTPSIITRSCLVALKQLFVVQAITKWFFFINFVFTWWDFLRQYLLNWKIWNKHWKIRVASNWHWFVRVQVMKSCLSNIEQEWVCDQRRFFHLNCFWKQHLIFISFKAFLKIINIYLYFWYSNTVHRTQLKQ